jgi:uncharacterized RDD family membrane protein YckC
MIMDNGNGQLDTTIQIVTPENIAFRYRVAGPFRRLLAYVLDLLIRLTIGLVGAMVMMTLAGILGVPGLGFGLTLAFLFLVVWFYGGLFEAFWNGQTPGKRMVRVRVLSVDGQPINGTQAILRNLLRAIDAQPLVFYQLGLLAAAMNDRFQRLGDLAAGTMVVIDEPNWFYGVVRVEEPEAIRLAARIPARFQPSRTLVQALAAYVQRRRFFAWGRRLEIARHLGEPLRMQFGLAPETNLDLLLCALYHRTFITDREESRTARPGSPFGIPQFLQPQSTFVQFGKAAETAVPTEGSGFSNRVPPFP